MAITYSFENNGDIITLSNSNLDESGFAKERGASGFGIAPTAVVIREGALGGGRHRNTRRGPREIDIPILFGGANTDEIESKMRRFARLMNDSDTAPRIVATYPDGTRYDTRFHYVAGADPIYGADSNMRSWARWPLTLRCPDPYWTAQRAQDYPITQGSTDRGIIKTGQSLSKLRLTGSQTMGTVTVENTGDVDAQPIWTIEGPATSFIATRERDGASFSYTLALQAGERIIVNTQNKTVTNVSGQNLYTNLGYAPKLFTIRPGLSKISIYMDGAGAGSLVAFNFRPRRELIFG